MKRSLTRKLAKQLTFLIGARFSLKTDTFHWMDRKGRPRSLHVAPARINKDYREPEVNIEAIRLDLDGPVELLLPESCMDPKARSTAANVVCCIVLQAEGDASPYFAYARMLEAERDAEDRAAARREEKCNAAK